MTLCYVMAFIPVTGPVYFPLFNSYNSLTEVEGSELRSLRQLEMLMLHGNDIDTVHSGAFYSLRSLQVECVYLNRTKDVSVQIIKIKLAFLMVYMQGG